MSIVSGHRRTQYKTFDGRRFKLYATADSKATALVVADAMRTRDNFQYYARVTPTKDEETPYKVWIYPHPSCGDDFIDRWNSP